MTPIEAMRKGIIEGDKNLLCEGFKQLTGEDLSWPDEKVITITSLKSAMEKVINELSIDTKKIKISKKQKESLQTEITNPTDKIGYYGNKTILITEEATKEEIESNKKWKEDDDKKERIKRPKFKNFKITCSDCEKKFESPVKPSSEIGQLCSRCLKKRRPG